jgi:hypothetical protein
MRQTVSVALNELRERVGAWRSEHGGRGSRIPEALWDEAVRVARVDGVWATAQALRFNYERLKARSGRGGRRASSALSTVGEMSPVARARSGEGAAESTRFIALDMAPGALGGFGRTVIDVEGRHGDRMRINVIGSVDVVGLVRTVWSDPS